MKNVKVLLLNSTYQALSFISERKAIKLLIKNKADAISFWKDIKISLSERIKYLPAIIKMNYYINIKFKRMIFSRKFVFRRDKYICQYCGEKVNSKCITMDHILPRSLGGENSFLNCVSSCQKCNWKKANKTLEDSGLELIKQPIVPSHFLFDIYLDGDENFWHESWKDFVK